MHVANALLKVWQGKIKFVTLKLYAWDIFIIPCMPGTVIIASLLHACIELWPKLVWTNASWNLCLALSLHDMYYYYMHANNNNYGTPCSVTEIV